MLGSHFCGSGLPDLPKLKKAIETAMANGLAIPAILAWAKKKRRFLKAAVEHFCDEAIAGRNGKR